MNVFVIPSWYPSAERPLTGIMVYEQTKALCTMYPDIQVGISVWGQQEDNYLLWAKDHVRNLAKVKRASKTPFTKAILANLKEYHKPTFSWTNKIADGNMQAIVKANLYNLRAFEADYGKADLIHAQVNHPAGRIAMAVSEESGIPFCITERMSPFPCSYSSDKTGKLKKQWYLPYTRSAANITISPAQARLMQQQGISNIRVIPNFVDEVFFRPGTSSKATDTFTFLTLTSFIPRKGIEVLLHAIQLLTQTIKDLKVTYRIGGIGEAGPYVELAKELGVAGNITWLKETDRGQALKEFQECDGFVLASFEESFGTVYAEAIACGKPVIATKCGGPESIVTDTNGLLVEKNDPTGLAAAMQQMVENYDRYDSTQIRQDFLSRFSKQAVLPRLVKLYKEIINTSSALS